MVQCSYDVQYMNNRSPFSSILLMLRILVRSGQARSFACFLGLALLLGTTPALAGSMDAPAAPDNPASAMFTTTDIYNRLHDGSAGAKRAGSFTMPDAAPGATGHTLDELMAKAPAKDDVNGATAADVLQGRTFFGLRSDGWGLGTGTLASRALDANAVTVPAGYYAATTLSAVDTDLISTNILFGRSIFGVVGDANVVDTATGDVTAADMFTGKVAWADGVEVTGTLSDTVQNSFTGANGSLSFAIPDGVYSGGKTATAADTNLSAGNIVAPVNIFGVVGTGPEPTGDATAAHVLSGRTFSNAAGGGTGTMTNNGAVSITPGTSSQAIAAGYHNGSGSVAGDADLVSGNIRSGVNIFGVAGNTNVVNTSTGTAVAANLQSGKIGYVAGAAVTGTTDFYPIPARVAKTGQIQCFDPGNGNASTDCNSCVGNCSGQDGQLRVGAGKVNPRFKDNGDGTVYDNLTGLMWMEDADAGLDCNGADTGPETWSNALLSAVACNTNVFAGHTDWRLPNVTELFSLIDYDQYNPSLTKVYPFTNIALGASSYWTSTTSSGSTGAAWGMNLIDATSTETVKDNTSYVWLVRGGQ